jgi:hypothetical protein
VYQVNSALLAASSPYLRQLIQHPPSLQHLVPGLSSVAARHRQRKLVTVLIQPHHVAAAEQVIRFIFTNDVALTSAQQALDALLVAEQLQVRPATANNLAQQQSACSSLRRLFDTNL